MYALATAAHQSSSIIIYNSCINENWVILTCFYPLHEQTATGQMDAQHSPVLDSETD